MPQKFHNEKKKKCAVDSQGEMILHKKESSLKLVQSIILPVALGKYEVIQGSRSTAAVQTNVSKKFFFCFQYCFRICFGIEIY